MSNLDYEERGILDAFDSGKTKRSKDAVEIQRRHQKYAEAMARKNARVSFQYPS